MPVKEKEPETEKAVKVSKEEEKPGKEEPKKAKESAGEMPAKAPAAEEDSAAARRARRWR